MSGELPIPPSGKAYSFNCPQCNASLLSALPEKLTAVSCDECGFVFLAQRPVKKAGNRKKMVPRRRGGSHAVAQQVEGLHREGDVCDEEGLAVVLRLEDQLQHDGRSREEHDDNEHEHDATHAPQ